MRVRVLCFIILMLAAGTESGKAQNAGKGTILAVFAHPDDETAVGPLLARYASAGHAVYLATITSGQKGATAHSNIPAGPELGKAREAELKCACEKLGINVPFLLQFEDQGISSMEAHEKVVMRLREIINVIKPEVLITWGPDGFSGHPDHRAASAFVTQIFQQSNGLVRRPRKLYYLAIPESLASKLPGPYAIPGAVRTVSDAFITTEVDCSEYLEAAGAAIECHQSQWTPEAIAMLKVFGEQVLEGKIYLRLAMDQDSGSISREDDLLEGIR